MLSLAFSLRYYRPSLEGLLYSFNDLTIQQNNNLNYTQQLSRQSMNKVEITRQFNACEVIITFEKSKYLSDIYGNIFVLTTLWLFGLIGIHAVFFGQDSNSGGILILWLMGLGSFSYLTLENILWLLKGHETLLIDHEKITLNKYIPLDLFIFNSKVTESILLQDLDRIYYKEYNAHKSNLPRPSKGNLHLKSKSNTISFGITLDQFDAHRIFKEIQRYIDQHNLKIEETKS